MNDPKQFVKEWRTYDSMDDIKIAKIADEIVIQHRTHQASLVRNLRTLCTILAGRMEQYGTDDRNEYALKWLEKVNGIDQSIPYI